jgi:ADP-L-glycero-D-manno-heptose 6-epimerase
MIIVTGGAGFIGSNIVKALNEAGEENILIVDHLGSSEKWKNLVDLNYTDFEQKDRFMEKVEKGIFDHGIWAVFHMGACSSTTELDADYLMSNNFTYTKRLAPAFIGKKGVRFIYASSAATYGAGELGYSDDHQISPRLRPLNMYGYSKQLFDMWAMRTKVLENVVGLKYFNVFGPNEYHKGDMRSVAIRSYFQAKNQGRVRLFKSYKPGIEHGEQKRDFIYVKDAVAVTLAFLERPTINGLFNVGAGEPRSFNDLAASVFKALGAPNNIEYIDMPQDLEKRYQYYTCADLTKLRNAGIGLEFMKLEDAVADYVNNYLEKDPRASQ